MATVPHFGPAPQIGDVWCRDDDHRGREEAAVVWRNVRDGGHWDALIMTGEDYYPLESGRFQQTVQHGDWRPLDFVWHDNAFMFARPGIAWDAEKKDWVETEDEEDEVDDAPQLPSLSVLPSPRKDEHPNSWRARCRKKFPVLDSEEGRKLLGQAWNEHKTKG